MAEVLLSDAPAPGLPSEPPRVALEERHLPQALQLSQALRWPYRLEDWRDALRLGHGVAVEIEGQVRATALWWPWGDRFATCGMIIVDDAFQGRGLGRALLRDLLRQAAHRTLLLRSTVAGLRLYEAHGFVAFGRVHQHQGTPAAAPREPGAGVREMQPGDAAAVLDLDRSATGMERERLVHALCAAGHGVVTGPQDRPSGYAFARRWGRGIVIGPVVAADAPQARALVAALVRRHAGDFVRIDVTEECRLSEWLEHLGLPCVDRVTSMAHGALPGSSSHAVAYALASQSLG